MGGWPKWCEDCANQSACVLIIPSEGWFAAYEKTTPLGVGLGAATEADLFRQTLSENLQKRAQEVAVLDDSAVAHAAARRPMLKLIPGRRGEPPWDGAGARLCCLQRAVDGSLEFAVELEGLVVSERQKLG